MKHWSRQIRDICERTILKRKTLIKRRLDQCFDPGALQRPAPPISQPLSRGSLFVSEIDRFWQGAIDGTLQSVVFRVLCLDNYLAKLCQIDRSRCVRIKNMSGRPQTHSGCRERPLPIKLFFCFPEAAFTVSRSRISVSCRPTRS